ncbi:MAG: RHS repeat-associated core domain-containing protein [Spongiibacteraceae bacterium]|nr:RHS repeat-associated core domain-containing protein [Spongiibacteraceae bacterium]
MGSTRSLSDQAGTITDTYHYEAFGEVLNQTGSTENDYKFTGEQYDEDLNQYYLRARYYYQHSGRFTQQDTWMGNNHDPITLHKYLYANADPVNYIDPTGDFVE